MSKGNSGLFKGTLGTSFQGASQTEDTYSGRGIEIPSHLKAIISRLRNKGDYVSGNASDFSMRDVSIISKETGVEFGKLTIGNKTYLIRGDRRGTDIPNILIQRMARNGGTLDFHSHPHDDDCIPSGADRQVMKQLREITGQRTSSIVTPNGRTVLFDEHGVIETGNVSNIIDKDMKAVYEKLFGGI